MVWQVPYKQILLYLFVSHVCRSVLPVWEELLVFNENYNYFTQLRPKVLLVFEVRRSPGRLPWSFQFFFYPAPTHKKNLANLL